MPQIPHLALTMGDPAGIGSEIILKALVDQELQANCQVTVIGDLNLLNSTYRHLLTQTELTEKDLADPQDLLIFDCPCDVQMKFGEGDFYTGAASFEYLTTAIKLTQQDQFQGIVTAPIAKYLWQQAGYDYPGQTEVLAEKSQTKDYGMLFAAQSPHTSWVLKALLATTHIPLSSVPQALNSTVMDDKLKLLIDSLKQDFGIVNPTIAIAGLNPHSGEAGQLGTEEVDWLADWLQNAQKQYPQCKLVGLIPPDTMWVKPGQAWYGNAPQQNLSVADAYLALYHDQGLIPVKLMAFDCAVNTTIGLPFIRTSPDHGTAFDIAGKGIADANSLKEAIKLAAQIVQNRQTIS